MILKKIRSVQNGFHIAFGMGDKKPFNTILISNRSEVFFIIRIGRAYFVPTKINVMYTGLLHLHNFLRWVIIILLIINIVRHFGNMNQPFTAKDKKWSLPLLISAHITFLLGLYQYFAGNTGFRLIQEFGFGVVMKDASMRFWAVEHITGMIISIALITVAHGKIRKSIPDVSKHKKMAYLFLFALIIILACVPWPFRELVARPLFPGMHL